MRIRRKQAQCQQHAAKSCIVRSAGRTGWGLEIAVIEIEKSRDAGWDES
jgi:hypothetical protein